MESLLTAAKKHIVTLMQIQNSVCSAAGNAGEVADSTGSVSEAHDPPLLKKFKYLSWRISKQAQPSLNIVSNVKMEIGRYIAEV